MFPVVLYTLCASRPRSPPDSPCAALTPRSAPNLAPCSSAIIGDAANDGPLHAGHEKEYSPNQERCEKPGLSIEMESLISHSFCCARADVPAYYSFHRVLPIPAQLSFHSTLSSREEPDLCWSSSCLLPWVQAASISISPRPKCRLPEHASKKNGKCTNRTIPHLSLASQRSWDLLARLRFYGPGTRVRLFDSVSPPCQPIAESCWLPRPSVVVMVRCARA